MSHNENYINREFFCISFRENLNISTFLVDRRRHLKPTLTCEMLFKVYVTQIFLKFVREMGSGPLYYPHMRAEGPNKPAVTY